MGEGGEEGFHGGMGVREEGTEEGSKEGSEEGTEEGNRYLRFKSRLADFLNI